MAISIPRGLVEYVLLGPSRDRRQLQDSPILGDVWTAFAATPGEPQEVLITPDKAQTAAHVAAELDEGLDRARRVVPHSAAANIAYLQGIVAARLYFDELLRVVVPITVWWRTERNSKEMQIYLKKKEGQIRLEKVLNHLIDMVAHWSDPTNNKPVGKLPSAFDRYAALAGIILWASKVPGENESKLTDKQIADAIKEAKSTIASGLTDLLYTLVQERPAAASKSANASAKRAKAPGNSKDKGAPALVYQVSLNREAAMAVAKSAVSVKADAARTLFSVNCSEIAWAVIDAGIQGDHPAFLGADGKSRVRASFDFSRYRSIVSLDNRRIFMERADETTQRETLARLLTDDLLNKPTAKAAKDKLLQIAEDMRNQRPIDWKLVEPFIAIKIKTPPRISDHGTHVAGIIGAAKRSQKDLPKGDDAAEYVNGMCPDIQLYDFRVIAESEDIKDTEFGVIAALQYLRFMNERHDYITIHGANLSLSIPHDVHNFACGRTPICDECERLIESGVVVVAAAGNLGYQNYQTKDGSYEGYAAFTVTDPGNADGVITVGSTHRTSPHAYGVSFFSSRGPTGDGRQKPDIVAPGERIRAPFREGWGDLDGTSMAAPHVSGAAAMLMARYPEMIRQPRRIKRILCESATDLGREKSFQGNGMLDVLRALQSI